jgi:protein involved in polysaccharide export with SLBB domain
MKQGSTIHLAALPSVVILLVCLGLLGCQATPRPKYAVEGPPERPTAIPVSKVTLSAGDTIEIMFPYASQFDETQTIRPDGMIVLPLVGEVMAEGKTPAELRMELIRLHAEQLKHPELAVVVRSFYDRRVFVGGEVNTPGVVSMPGPLTALEAIMEAGGFAMDRASSENVVLIRHENGQRQIYELDYESALQGKPYEPVYLQSQDVIYVPRTGIANVGQWVQQHIYDLLPPVGFGLGYTW